jgi:hypothetical protein
MGLGLAGGDVRFSGSAFGFVGCLWVMCHVLQLIFLHDASPMMNPSTGTSPLAPLSTSPGLFQKLFLH